MLCSLGRSRERRSQPHCLPSVLELIPSMSRVQVLGEHCSTLREGRQSGKASPGESSPEAAPCTLQRVPQWEVVLLLVGDSWGMEPRT